MHYYHALLESGNGINDIAEFFGLLTEIKLTLSPELYHCCGYLILLQRKLRACLFYFDLWF